MIIDNPESTDNISNRAETPSIIAKLLRYLGAAAVLISSVIYMLQGVDNIGLEFRNWVYIALMSIMAMCGYFCRTTLSDVKGARLLLALSAVLIPVQFSQLGGMSYVLFGDHDSVISHFDFTTTTVFSLLTTLGISVLILLPITWISFSVLVRDKSATLVGAFVILNMMLLLPFRLSVMGLMTIASLFFVCVLLEWKVYSTNRLFKTREGLILKCIMALPLVIATVRLGFHLGDVAGLALTSLLVAAGLSQLSYRFIRSIKINECLLLISVVIGVLSWVVLCLELFGYSNIALITTATLLPIVGILLFASLRSHYLAWLYRYSACVFGLLAGYVLFESDSSLVGIFHLCFASLTIGWGLWQKQRATLLTGIVLALAGMFVTISSALTLVSVNLWIVLAVAGLSCVVLSSVLEKYGRYMLGQAQLFWDMK